jgi:hypothetical protein
LNACAAHNGWHDLTTLIRDKPLPQQPMPDPTCSVDAI